MSEIGLVAIFSSLEEYWEHLDKRPRVENEEIQAHVRDVLERVRIKGDAALLEYTRRFDEVEVPSLLVGVDLMEAALSGLNPVLKDVWIEALNNIEQFHSRQCEDSRFEFCSDGSVVGWKVSPLDRVGVCVPDGRGGGGPASLFMGVVPAQLAGVKEILVAASPGKDGLPHSNILAAGALLGLEHIYAVGGVQAIAALAWGTESIPRVDKIVGPSNRGVAEAKRQIYGEVGVDLLTEPSELVILCTRGDIPAGYLAGDLLAQAEQDDEARAMLVTTSQKQAQAVTLCLEELIPTLPRADIIKASFANGSGIVVVKDLAAGLEVINELAPANLELLTADPFSQLAHVCQAGAIFLGPHTPQSVGYCFGGTNHLVPTGGRARFSSSLGVGDFIKRSPVLGYSRARFEQESEKIIHLSESEHLFSQAEALRMRTSKNGGKVKKKDKK